MRVTVLFLLFALVFPASAQEITVAAAADLHFALDEISAQFQKEHRGQVKVIYGSSGNFYQQIQNGAPVDIFFSANDDYPKKLEEAGLAIPGSYYEYARGGIVLLTSSGSRLDLKQGLNILLNASVKKISIADPAHAPYGQAAVAALKYKNLYDKVAARIVTAENISQAASFVLSGAADIGIVAKSLAIIPASHRQAQFAEISQEDYPPIRQACVILKSSKQQKLAREFRSYVAGRDAARILRKYGFEIPEHAGKNLQ
jgi:molybdate transport system substrate-binding protein